MTTFPRLLLSLLLVASCCLLVFGAATGLHRRITKTLHLSNGFPWGTWGNLEYCEDGSFAAYLEAKFEQYAIRNADETALNALGLYCVDKDTHVATGRITSTVGKKGEWQGMRICSTGYLTAVRARVLEPQGLFSDDVAIQNFHFDCNYGSDSLIAVDEAKDTKISNGPWGDWVSCPLGSGICAIQARYNAVGALLDDVGLSDVVFSCCSFNDTVTLIN